MKRIIFTLLPAIALATNAFAQTDTLVISHPEEVKVATAGDTMSVSIIGEKNNPNFFYSKKVVLDSEQEDVTTTSKNAKSGLGWDFSLIESDNGRNPWRLYAEIRPQLYAGWNIPLGKPSDMRLKWFPSREAGLDIARFAFRPRTGKWGISLDWGIMMSEYHFKDCMMTMADNGNISMSQFPEGSSEQSSYMRTVSLSFTLMGRYRIGKQDEIGLGVTWNEQTSNGCYYKTKYKLSDGSSIVDMNEIPVLQNRFSIKAEYMFDHVGGIYLRYTPMSILKKSKAPNFQQLTLGLQVRF